MHEGMYGLIANVILLVGISLATEPDESARVEKFMKG
jgi:hypothetical protein